MKYLIIFLMFNTPTIAGDDVGNGGIEYFPRFEVELNSKGDNWETLNEIGNDFCKGQGFIRKFADGTNDWANRARPYIEVRNLSCLNFQDTLVFKRPINVNLKNYRKEISLMCVNPGKYGVESKFQDRTPGCGQVSFLENSDRFIYAPKELRYKKTRVSTLPDKILSGLPIQESTLSNRAPYMPRPFINEVEINPNTLAQSYFINPLYAAQSIYLPIYIGGRSNILSVTTSYYYEGDIVKKGVPATYIPDCKISRNPLLDLHENEWCIQNDEYTNFYDVLHIRGAKNPIGLMVWSYGGFNITFNSINTPDYTYSEDDPMAPKKPNQRVGMEVGSALYYLTKLSRLELMGIPQMFYEPIYCNSDREELIKGIYRAGNRTNFEKNAYSFSEENSGKNLLDIYDQDRGQELTDISNPNSKVVKGDQMSINPVFSGNEFKCCKKLGEMTLSPEVCCSGYGTSIKVDNKIVFACKLAPGTDLSVYFNRYVSNEGIFNGEDYIIETGELKISEKIDDTLMDIGTNYCSSGKVQKGSIFGNFYPQPNQGFFTTAPVKFFSILDNSLDNDEDRGFIDFLKGFRWNHHTYCAE